MKDKNTLFSWLCEIWSLKQPTYLQIHESESNTEIFMSLPRIALFSDSEYAALRVGVLWEGKEKDFTRTITVKTVMVGVGVYHRNFLLWHLYSVEVFIVRKSWKVLMTIRTDDGCCVRLSLQLVWFQDCRKTKDNLSFLLPIIFACFLGFSVCRHPASSRPNSLSQLYYQFLYSASDLRAIIILSLCAYAWYSGLPHSAL